MRTLALDVKSTYILYTLLRVGNGYSFMIQPVSYYVDFYFLMYFHKSLILEVCETTITFEIVFKFSNCLDRIILQSNLMVFYHKY